MLVNIVVPGYRNTLPFQIDQTKPLQSYSWVDIVSANIIADTSKHVKVLRIEYENEPIQHSRSLAESNISENAVLYVHVQVNDLNTMMNNHTKAVSDMELDMQME